ncbi:MAG: thioredoxin domain-containing protein [Rhodospirillaceae bacterium]|jgi:uncharacterized protein|nr:thioredoxin domain-containing protein [Rhodospirillaceae bacterium]MBT3557890.1 thioredoxin domain-containing protein [Rhodospirillales bacterium]MBT4628211.1 thioredoxin domain-containing protein [Rhodospirillales bacterium]MBT5350834.1 thioredoxin domain-containing protein [Rhodospirillales bacterium]MBT5520411.1 thioredoxin domain-containing protein [Rhodospirillales bacterium]
MTNNVLSTETSPYLLQHKDNPVHWQPWSEGALARATSENKPILLSIGYAACHWCHVMAHESFESDTIADLMNEQFVCIKVDREERPDLDAIYQSALSMLGEQGGWPLTMFLKPDGSPFWGGTYFPPEPRYGRPGFPQVLNQISALYKDQKEQVDHNASALTDALRAMGSTGGGSGGDSGNSLTMGQIDDTAITALQLMDMVLGGTKGAPKFPQPTFLKFLWNGYLRSRDQRLFEAVVTTLSQMCQGGIYDHLGGGFSRYSVDEEWLAPHFEKMLYDNALLIELMTDVWQETRLGLYETRIRETIRWMLSDLRNAAPDGLYALASAYDADSEGVEGKFYVWSQDEIAQHLGDGAVEFCAAYDVTQFGNWEGHTILRRAVGDMDTDPDRATRLAASRRALLDIRSTRIPPQRDDKVLADWNGMAIAALVRAGLVFDEPDWITEAVSLYRFVSTHMRGGDRLYHTWCAGKARHAGVIDDYANMARAAIMLHQACQDPAYLQNAATWTSVADKHFWDAGSGGYFLAADDTRDLVVRTKTLFDNATPTGGGIMLDVVARLFHLTGDTGYRDRADAIISALAPEDTRALMNQPSLALGLEILTTGLQVVIVSPDPNDPLFVAAAKSAPNHATVSVISATGALPDTHPAAGKTTVGGEATAYVCQNNTCGLPITTPDALVAALLQTA